MSEAREKPKGSKAWFEIAVDVEVHRAVAKRLYNEQARAIADGTDPGTVICAAMSALGALMALHGSLDPDTKVSDWEPFWDFYTAGRRVLAN